MSKEKTIEICGKKISKETIIKALDVYAKLVQFEPLDVVKIEKKLENEKYGFIVKVEDTLWVIDLDTGEALIKGELGGTFEGHSILKRGRLDGYPYCMINTEL